jgi:hypothetical protein
MQGSAKTNTTFQKFAARNSLASWKPVRRRGLGNDALQAPSKIDSHKDNRQDSTEGPPKSWQKGGENGFGRIDYLICFHGFMVFPPEIINFSFDHHDSLGGLR